MHEVSAAHIARLIGTLLVSASLASCAGFEVPRAPSTPGAADQASTSSYGYQPLDPLPVNVVGQPATLVVTRKVILDSLPDDTMRMAVGKFDASGRISFGPASANVAQGSYVVIIDYTKTDTIPVYLTKSETAAADGKKSTVYAATLSPQANDKIDTVVPAFVGVGLRLTATLTTRKGGVDLGGLFAIGLAAQAGDIRGTLVVQTLGVSGDTISATIPIPTDISVSSIEAAIGAIGVIKSKLYDPNTRIRPRVVGIYNPIAGGPEAVTAYVSALLERVKDFKVQEAPQ